MIEHYHHKLEEHYTRSLDEISLTGKAPKDVVGQSYEQFREEIITQFPDLDIATVEERKEFDLLFGGNYKADQYIVCKKTRRVIALEEDKGHYVDKCFAKRALFNAAEVFHHCIRQDLEAPYFILSCPTDHDIGALLEDKEGFFAEEIYALLVERFKFFPLCSHGRTSRHLYLKSSVMPFDLDDVRIQKEVDFFQELNT